MGRFLTKNYDAPSVRHTTCEAHRYVLKNHILPWIGDCPLESLTTQKIEEFLEEHQLHGNKRNGKPLSQQTMRHIQNLLSKVLSQAVNRGLIERNPVQGICRSAPKQVKATILADNEIRDYLSAAKDFHKLTERVLMEDLYDRTPHILDHAITILLGWGETGSVSEIPTFFLAGAGGPDEGTSGSHRFCICTLAAGRGRPV